MIQRIKHGLKNFVGALREITPLLELVDAIVALVMHVIALLTTLHAVSYTHLDVYKRQPSMCTSRGCYTRKNPLTERI